MPSVPREWTGRLSGHDGRGGDREGGSWGAQWKGLS